MVEPGWEPGLPDHGGTGGGGTRDGARVNGSMGNRGWGRGWTGGEGTRGDPGVRVTREPGLPDHGGTGGRGGRGYQVTGEPSVREPGGDGRVEREPKVVKPGMEPGLRGHGGTQGAQTARVTRVTSKFRVTAVARVTQVIASLSYQSSSYQSHLQTWKSNSFGYKPPVRKKFRTPKVKPNWGMKLR